MHSVLTSREYEIFNYLLDNLTTKEIASLLHITEKTVRNHISNVIIKLDVKSRSQAIVKLLLMNEIKLKR
ncbi:MAG: response regulator transcription factor [Bacilli bacterium]|nr:response regulator transcription factor [Bacilli bacterium]